MFLANGCSFIGCRGKLPLRLDMVIAITFPVFVNFALHKFITFREAPELVEKESGNA